MSRTNQGAGKKQAAARDLRLPVVLRWFWVGSLAAFGLMVVVGYARYRMGYPRTHYNPLGGARYEDLMEFVPVYRLLHTEAFFQGVGGSRVAYPPLGAVVYAALYGTGHAIGVYLGAATVWIAAGVWGIRRELMRRGLGAWIATLFPLTVALVSFPIAGLLQRGNIELFVWMLASVGVWAWLRGRNEAAAALWGLAAAIKLYPVALLVLLLPRRGWKAAAIGVGTFVVATLVAMMWLGPTISVALHGSLRNVFGYQGVRVGQWTLHELATNHSALGLAKFVAMVWGLPLGRLTAPYYFCGAAVFAAIWFGRVRKMPEANQLLAVTAFMVMLPPVSYFYTLVQLYVPWLMLVCIAIEAERLGVRIRGMGWVMGLLIGVFASFMLFTFPREYIFGGLVQGAMLIGVFGCAVVFRLEVHEKRPQAELSAGPMRI